MILFYVMYVLMMHYLFSNETDKSFCQTNLLGLNEDNNIENLSFKLSRAEKKSINQISNLILETNDPNHQSKSLCDYYSIDDFVKKDFNQNEHFSIFHLNIHSLQFHMHDLEILLDALKFEFDILAISETKISKKTLLPSMTSTFQSTILNTPPLKLPKGALFYTFLRNLIISQEKIYKFIYHIRLSQHLLK